MKPVLVILGTATIEVNKATFQKVDHVLYMDAEGQNPAIEGFDRAESIDNAVAICQYVIENGYADSYVIPSRYKGEIILPEGVELPSEYPKDFNWGFIEDCLPNYYQRDEVLHCDLMNRFVDEGEENPEQHDIDWMREGEPEFLSPREWVFHRMTELEIQLFEEAGENKFS